MHDSFIIGYKMLQCAEITRHKTIRNITDETFYKEQCAWNAPVLLGDWSYRSRLDLCRN